jgi:D-alanine-D-alanine ligase
MHIGMTYDLRDDYRATGTYSEEALAEFDSVETIDALEAALRAAGHDVDRIGNIRMLAPRLVAGDRWDLVFNIAEGLSGRSREAQVPALLEAYSIPYVFSDPLTQAATLDKAVAKRLVRDAGLPTAPFAVIAGDADAERCALPYPVFLKPVAEGTGKGCELTSKVSDKASLACAARELRARFDQPVLAETFLPGREFTVGILGTGETAEAIGVLEITLNDSAEPEIYSFVNKELCETKVTYTLVDDAEARAAAATALAAYRALDCRDAARIDLRSDAAGIPHFLEINTVAGMHPTHSDLPMLATAAGIPYEALVARIVDAAANRYGLTATTRPPAKMGFRPYVPVLHGASADRPDEADTLAAAQAVRDSLKRLGYDSDIVAMGLDFRPVTALAARAPLTVFNLVEAIDSNAALADMACTVMDHAGLRYTGCPGPVFATLREKTRVKEMLHAAGLPTPAWSMSAAPAGDRVIVKSETEHASYGIDADSVVPAARAQAEITEREARFGGRFFSEAYIEGREFNLSILETATGPRVLPVAEIDFTGFPADRPQIVDYGAKWLPDDLAFTHTNRRFDFPLADQPLLRQLRDLALSAWRVLSLSGYARVDFRVDAENRPWILEVNVNPCLSPDAGFVATAARDGTDFDGVIAAIVDAAGRRLRRVA